MDTQKRGPKPRVDREHVRTERLGVAFSPHDLQALRDAALSAGKSLATYVRKRLGLRG